MAYYSLVQSHITYGILAWGHSGVRHRIFGLQRRVVRLIAGIGYTADCKECFTELRILTVPSLYVYACLKYFFKNGRDSVRHSDIHKYNTRNKDAYVMPTARLAGTVNSAEYDARKLFNALPTEITQLRFDDFKLRVREILIGRALYSIEDFFS